MVVKVKRLDYDGIGNTYFTNLPFWKVFRPLDTYDVDISYNHGFTGPWTVYAMKDSDSIAVVLHRVHKYVYPIV